MTNYHSLRGPKEVIDRRDGSAYVTDENDDVEVPPGFPDLAAEQPDAWARPNAKRQIKAAQERVKEAAEANASPEAEAAAADQREDV